MEREVNSNRGYVNELANKDEKEGSYTHFSPLHPFLSVSLTPLSLFSRIVFCGSSVFTVRPLFLSLSLSLCPVRLGLF